MKKTMTVALVSVLAIIALIFVAGLVLPAQRTFIKQATLKSPVEQVFRVVTDFKQQTDWRSDIQAIKPIDDHTWTELPKNGTPLTFKTKQKIENQVFEMEIIEPQSFQGYWIGTFEKTPANGTKVVFKEVVTVNNPFFRVFSFLFVDLDKTMEIYLTDLRKALGE